MDWVGSVNSLGCSCLKLEFEDEACIRVIFDSDIPNRASAIGISLTQHPECRKHVIMERTSPMKFSNDEWKLATYYIGDDAFDEDRVVVVTREPRKGRKLGLSEIFSHRIHKVDNTGNIRVWRAERALLHTLLQPKQREALRGKRLLEIGGGMTGLAGIGLACSTDLRSVVVTDGNPMAVDNQRICVQLNSMTKNQAQVDCRILLWDRKDTAGQLVEVLSAAGGGKFDAIIGADCLFFSDFHQDLLYVLQVSLAPNGEVWLLQQPRGGTMNQFISIAEKSFLVELRDDFDNEFKVASSPAADCILVEDKQQLKLLVLRHKV